MTNWMTAAGLALIAGGLATLISFRTVLFSSGAKEGRAEESRAKEGRTKESRPRRTHGERRAGRKGRVRAEDPVPAEDQTGVKALPPAEVPLAAPEEIKVGENEQLWESEEGAHHGEVRIRVEGRTRSERRRARAVEALARGAENEGGLAALGFAHEETPEQQPAPADLPEFRAADIRRATRFEPEQPTFAPAVEPVPGPVHAWPQPFLQPLRRVDRSDRGYGDRVDDWVRPEYRDQPGEPEPGEYWTPIPVDMGRDPEPSARGYGWPRPVERLPAVPPYEPATGFDLTPVEAEPTEFVTSWPVNEDRSPAWARRNEKADEPRRRPRPRPRPRRPAAEEPPMNRSVYVSRHAAEPPR